MTSETTKAAHNSSYLEQSPSQFIIFRTKSIIFNAKSIMFHVKFIIYNTNLRAIRLFFRFCLHCLQLRQAPLQL